MNLNGLLAQGLDAVGEGDVVLRFAVEIGAVTVDDEAKGLLANFEHLIGAAAQVFRHADAACVELFVRSDVGVGKQHPNLLRNLQRRQLCGERTQGGGGAVLQKAAAGKRGQGDGHGRIKR